MNNVHEQLYMLTNSNHSDCVYKFNLKVEQWEWQFNEGQNIEVTQGYFKVTLSSQESWSILTWLIDLTKIQQFVGQLRPDIANIICWCSKFSF